MRQNDDLYDTGPKECRENGVHHFAEGSRNGSITGICAFCNNLMARNAKSNAKFRATGMFPFMILR